MMMMPLVLALLGGLTVDLWLASSVRGRLAALADDAAAAGATAVDEQALRQGAVRLDPSTAAARVDEAIRRHGDAHRVESRQVEVIDDVVVVQVTGTAELTLLRLAGATSVPIRVTGAARPSPRAG